MDHCTTLEQIKQSAEDAGNADLAAEIAALIEKHCGGGATTNSGGGPNTPPKKED